MSDRVEQGIQLASVPGLKVIGQCSIACKDYAGCDFFVFSPRPTPLSYFYNDCMLGKRVNGDMVTEVGKVTGYPGLEPGDCPALTGELDRNSCFKLNCFCSAPIGWVGCSLEHPDGVLHPDISLTEEEQLQLNTRQCVELCRSDLYIK